MRHYFLYFIVFCILVGGGSYVFNSSPIPLSLFQYTLSLPLAVWISLSLLIFFIGSLFFFASDWAKKFLFEYRLKKDFENLIEQIKNQLLEKEGAQLAFKTPSFQTLSNILQKITMHPKLGTPLSKNTKIDHLFSDFEEIEKGGISTNHLKPHSIFWEKNLQNKIKSDLKFAQKVLDEDYSESLKTFALHTLLDQNSISEKTIQKLIKVQFDSKTTSELLRYFLQHGYRLDQEAFLKLFSNLDQQAIIPLIQELKSHFDPDFCISLFARLASQDSKFYEAYAYVLLDYSMFEKAKEFVYEHENLLRIKAYISLQEKGENYPLEIFFY
ncbi:hypothetical protein [Helicobacter kayseriensis]|uniref:hypothetical protein n=1 Tax=Helicobacter kayseriensis TaxID=2905877 RepID=UPI001E55F04E|nr:hypothetical protein [Helicobacter kayseriensis]MCE3047772.1 hypothetical protein [Helicobacter kayseriensis]MCE3049129.1 hypothetical protein [Helicobacter kayseriensis]